MSWLTILAIYFTVWWTALFAVLPWGNNAPPTDVPMGHATSAPANPRLKQKFIWTSIVAAVITGAMVFVDVMGIFSLRDFVAGPLNSLFPMHGHGS